MRIASTVAALVCAATLSTALPAAAASGLAWDSVTKFSMGDTVPQPGTFAADFATASAQQPPKPSGRGGMFGAIGDAMSAGRAAVGMMTNGMAERHYVAGALRRVDSIGAQTAEITDCTARTVTTLNLAKKTYKVRSLDAPISATAAPVRGRPAAADPLADDGTKVAVAIATTALGAKAIDGLPTAGYTSSIAVTTTKPSGESAKFNLATTSYFSSYVEPAEVCRGVMIGGSASAPGAANAMMVQRIMGAMRTPKGDPRFTFSASGPALPANRLSLFSLIQPSLETTGGAGVTVVTERGNIRAVNDADKTIFAVPADFTLEN